MVNAFSGSSTFVQELIEVADTIGENSLDLKAAIDRTVLCNETNGNLLTRLAALESNMRNLKLLIAQAQGVNVANLETLLTIEICKEL